MGTGGGGRELMAALVIKEGPSAPQGEERWATERREHR